VTAIPEEPDAFSDAVNLFFFTVIYIIIFVGEFKEIIAGVLGNASNGFLF